MAERSISVRVSAAVGGYVTSMQAAAAATKELGASTAAAAATNEKAFTRIGSGAAIGGALILASLGAAAKAAAEFDAQMSVVKANIDDKSAPSMKRLSDAALQAGSTTAYSATQAGKAEEELAKAGLSAADITGGALTAALNLASAGQLDLGDAAETTASTMVQFKLKASDAAHIADVLAAGADKSLGGVQDLSEALKYAGVPASQFGISLDSTVGVLAEFASNGITGSMAGTSLRQMLLSLASPTKEAQGVMDEYGISVFDASGKFVGLAGAAEQLKSKLGPLSQKQQQAALSSLFTARSVATANILMRGGAADVNKWTKAVNDQGFASQQASTKLDNLNGDLRKLKNTLNVDLIKAGQDATGALRGTAKGANFMAKAFGDLPGPAREVLTGLALVSGAGLLLIGTIGTAIPKVQNFRTSLESMGTAGAKVNSALGVVGKSLGIGIPLIGLGAAAWELWKQHTEAARRATEDMTQAIEADNGVIGENTNKLIAHGLQTSGAVDAAKRLKIPLQEVTEAILNGGPALDKLNSKLEQSGLDAARASLKHHDLGGQYAKNAGAAQTLKDAINGQNSTLEKAVHASKNDATAQKAVKAATDDATKSKKSAAQVTKDQVQAQKDLAKANASNPTYLLTGALLDLSPAAARSADKIKALSTALQQYNDLAYGSASASAAAGDALAALAKAKTANVNVDQILSDNLLSANDNTRTLAEQLGSTGDAYTKQLSQIYKDTAAQKGNNAAIIAVNKTHGQQVAALQRTLAKMGITGKAADELIAKYAGVPKDISTDVQLARVAQAKHDADDVKKHVNDIPIEHTTQAKAEIAQAERDLASVKQQIKDVPNSKKTTLLAEISQLEATIDTAKYYIDHNIPRNVEININGVFHTPSSGPNGLGGPIMSPRAAGGRLGGIGTATSDSNLTPTSVDEFMIKASSSKKVGYDVLDYINKYGQLPPKATKSPGYASSRSGGPGGPAGLRIKVELVPGADGKLDTRIKDVIADNAAYDAQIGRMSR